MIGDLLIDPVDGSALRRTEVRGRYLVPPVLVGCEASAIGATPEIVATESGAAYPVVDGIPVLMRTERLLAEPHEAQIAGTHFEEAYQEQRLYADLAVRRLGANARGLTEVRRIVNHADPNRFPEPTADWFGAGSTAGAYGRAMRHLAPVKGGVVLQIGGVGTHALKLLHAGASLAIVVSPVVRELVEGRMIAAKCGLEDRAIFVAGVAEELPIASASIDTVYSGSSIHHTDTTLAFPEINRVLATGGRWATVDVWKSRLHSIGTAVLGKCHGNAYCKPLSNERLDPAFSSFPGATVSFHGGTVRYALAVAERAGLRPGPQLGVQLARLEDAIPLGPFTRSLSSLVCATGVASPVHAEDSSTSSPR